jgi:sugar lactone lactonase YvrE
MRRVSALVLFLVTLTSTAQAQYVARIAVPPGPFHGVHGLAFGPDSKLYAGDIMGASVYRVNVETGAARVEIPAPMGMADDVAFAPVGTPFAGTMVWTGVGTGKLYARAPGGKPRVIADKLPSVNTVGFAPDGRLFVTQTGPANKTLWQVDLSGALAPKQIWDGTGGLNGFVIAADGYLYGPQADLGTVIRLDLATMETKVLADGFQWPTAVEMDSKGALYVLDFNAGTVSRVNTETGEKSVLVTIEPGLDNMAMGPVGSAHTDKLYISSIGRNGIFELDTTTNKLRTVTEGKLTAPGGVTVLGEGDATRVYIADMFTLREVNPITGSVRSVMPISGTGSYPATVNKAVMDGRDVLITGSWFSGRLQVIEPASGNILREISGLKSPHDAVMLPDGDVLVAEAGAGRIMRIAADGTQSVLAADLQWPTGLALGADTLYVSDSGAGTVTAITVATGAKKILAQGLKQPEGLALLKNGRLVVTEPGAENVLGIDVATGKMSEITTRTPIGLKVEAPLPATWIFNGIAEGSDGSLYLPSDVQSALYVLQLGGGPTSSLGALRALTSAMFR